MTDGSVPSGIPLARRLTKTLATIGRSEGMGVSRSMSDAKITTRWTSPGCGFSPGWSRRTSIAASRKLLTIAATIWSGLATRGKR